MDNRIYSSIKEEEKKNETINNQDLTFSFGQRPVTIDVNI